MKQNRLITLLALLSFSTNSLFSAAAEEFFKQDVMENLKEKVDPIIFYPKKPIVLPFKEQPVTPQAPSLLDKCLFRSSETDFLIKIVTKIKDLIASGKNEDSALATTFMIKNNNFELIHLVKQSLLNKANPDALGTDNKPLLVGAGPRLTSLLLSRGADPYAEALLAIKEAQDTLVKEKLEKKMQLLAEKLDPKAYSKPWADYLQWKKDQA